MVRRRALSWGQRDSGSRQLLKHHCFSRAHRLIYRRDGSRGVDVRRWPSADGGRLSKLGLVCRPRHHEQLAVSWGCGDRGNFTVSGPCTRNETHPTTSTTATTPAIMPRRWCRTTCNATAIVSRGGLQREGLPPVALIPPRPHLPADASHLVDVEHVRWRP